MFNVSPITKNLAMLLILMFTITYLMIPLYKTLCVSLNVGYSNWISYYIDMVSNQFSILNNIFIVSYESDVVIDMKVHNHSECMVISNTKEINTQLGEISMGVLKIVNHTENDVVLLPIMTVIPSEVSVFVYKYQCFCFEEVFVPAGELLLLPILYEVSNLIKLDTSVADVHRILIIYSFYEM